jgi:hypothetical protein
MRQVGRWPQGIKDGVRTFLEHWVGDSLFASDDVLKEEGLDSHCPSQIGLKQTQSPNLRAIKYSGFDSHVQEVHLGLDILEMTL